MSEVFAGGVDQTALSGLGGGPVAEAVFRVENGPGEEAARPYVENRINAFFDLRYISSSAAGFDREAGLLISVLARELLGCVIATALRLRGSSFPPGEHILETVEGKRAMDLIGQVILQRVPAGPAEEIAAKIIQTLSSDPGNFNLGEANQIKFLEGLLTRTEGPQPDPALPPVRTDTSQPANQLGL